MQRDAYCAVASDSQRKNLAAFTSVAACIGIAALFVFAGVSQGSRLAQHERVRALLEASTVRVAIESGLNERINLERGIVAYLASAPGIDARQYEAFARALVLDDPVIINLAVLEGTTIKFVYPFERNKAAVGRDLGLIPEQAGDVRRVMTSREPIVSGPLELVQGGVGIISRLGIFPVGPGGPEYWGQASIVLDADEILRQAGIHDHPSLRFLLASKTDRGVAGLPIYGDPSVLDADPILLEVNLPGVSWALAVAPEGGWKTFRLLTVLVSAFGLAIALFAGFATFSLLTTRSALKELAYHDQLTELPNRSLFWDRLRVETARAEREGTGVCVCMIDLDGFKAVNDDLGHEAGDRLLAAAAARMSAAIRKSDTVARLGGDEFAVIAPVDDPSGVEEVLSRLRDCFREPFDLGGVSRASRASIGCAVYPGDGMDAEALLAKADSRMYDEKRSDDRPTASRTTG